MTEPPFLIFFFICLGNHILRSAYEVLKAKNKIDARNKFVFAFMFFNMALLWISWFKMCELDPVQLPVPVTAKAIGLILFLMGIVLCILTLLKLKAFENTDRLVVDGIFTLIRHPMYMGFILWIVGYAIFLQAQTALLTAFLWIPNILFWRCMEERGLVEKFNDYRGYQKKTLF